METAVPEDNPDVCRIVYSNPPQALFKTAASEFASPRSSNPFTKGVQWSPDGTCMLTATDDNKLRILELPDAARIGAWARGSGEPHPASSVLQCHEGETVYDYSWYPRMNSADPPSCVLASTCRDHPVHLWDAFSGELRATYRAYNHVDEIFAAYSVAFDPAGDRIYAGYKGELRQFDLSRPGRTSTKTTLGSRKTGGQRGMVSCMSLNPDYSGLLATGSYDKSICLLSTHEGVEVLSVFDAHACGITQVQFSPNGMYLYSAARKEGLIHCWDIRNTGQILCTIQRPADTNQHIEFDLDPSGEHLVTGGTDGVIRVFNVPQNPELQCSFHAHNDCCNGVSVHPWLPIVASSSGQRHFSKDPDESEGDENCETLPENQICGWQFDWSRASNGGGVASVLHGAQSLEPMSCDYNN